ncbi:oligosaccharide flippase family protein [Ekhidna sp.]|jgi:O-antigen/teichoic acid export membrane protein|uniref:lipopolysaccharide biosynthesis protein n=1 Tax=Ekhidna sp. TaxID=2608089 RepID=UPI0032EF0D80
MLAKALKFLAKDSAIYGISGVLQKLLALLIIPLVSRYLTKEEFGLLNSVTPYAMVFAGLVTLGQDSAIARWFFDKTKGLSEDEHRVNVATTGFIIQLAGGIAFLVTFFCLGNKIGGFLFSDKDSYIRMWNIALVSAPASAFMMFSSNIFKWTFKRNKYLLLTISNSLSAAGLTIFFIILDYGLKGIILAPVISSSTFAIVGLILTRKYLRLSAINEMVHFKQMLKYGLPFGLVLIAGTLIPNIDRIFLIKYVEADVIGEYTLALKIASIFILVNKAFQISFGPYSFSIWEEKYAPKLYAQLSLLYFSGLIFMSLCLSSIADYLVLIVGSEKYLSAAKFIPWIFFAYVIDGMKLFTNIGISYSKKSYYHILLLIIAIIVAVSINYFSVNSIGAWGAILGLIFAYSIRNIVAFLISRKYYQITFSGIDFLWVTSYALVFYFLCSKALDSNMHILTGLKALMIVSFPLLIYLKILTKDQRKSLIKKMTNIFQ